MYRKLYGNGIYQLTDEEKSLTREHILFYKDLFKFGNYILDHAFKQEELKDYELTIYSNLYRILELLDTLMVMTQKGLINSGFIILRSLVESAAQLKYMIDDEEKMESRAIVLQMLNIKRSIVDETLFFDRMNEKSCYAPYIDLLKNNKFDNWYSYSENKKINIASLFRIIGWDEIYKTLYQPLCRETHGVTHMESNIHIDNKMFYFKPFRSFENHILLLDCILRVVTPLFTQFFNIYRMPKMERKWKEYNLKVQDYVTSNEQFSEVEKLFNPEIKWF